MCDYHDHSHSHEPPPLEKIELHEPILAENDRQALMNRAFFDSRGITAINLLSSPGSGKTALIERTLLDTGRVMSTAVIVGDLATDLDARRIGARGSRVIQVTTGTACHLDAKMVKRAAASLDLHGVHLILIENVGNLVCPASFDLGEHARVVILSTTEGEDKPLKYPPIFHDADLVLINKIDLAKAVEFNRDAARENIRKVAPVAAIFEVSAKKGDGMAQWYSFLEERIGGPEVRRA